MSDRHYTSAAREVLDEFLSHNLAITPMYPCLLIAVLPRPENTGLIVVPQGKHFASQPLHEAVVLQAYEPKRVAFSNHKTSETVRKELLELMSLMGDGFEGVSSEDDASAANAAFNTLSAKIEAGFEHESSILLQSDLKPGDHILFRHWSGQPLASYTGPHDIRFIPDYCIWYNHEKLNGLNDSPSPFAVIEYDKPNPEDILNRILSKHLENASIHGRCENLEEQVLARLVLQDLSDEYHLVPKHSPNQLEY
jgi:hypothetical protein